jgi:hypothetical protein
MRFATVGLTVDQHDVAHAAPGTLQQAGGVVGSA